jgi:cell division protein FtsN
MAQKDKPATTGQKPAPHVAAVAVPDDDDALRKRLLSRIAVAGVAIVGLLGGLAVYDALNKPEVPAMPPMAAAPAETGPAEKKDEAAAEKPAPEADAEKAEADEDAKRADAGPVPERSETPLAPPPRVAKTPTPPATGRTAAIRPSAPAAAPLKPDAPHELAGEVAEGTHPAPPRAQARHAPAARPLKQAAESAKRFLVQVGVFSNHANAEELLAKLQQAGIPAQIESRVQVGPFASRTEADAARAKLKALGIDDGLLVRR